MNDDIDKLPLRVRRIIARVQAGETLAMGMRNKESGEAEQYFWFEPSQKRCGPKSAAMAIETPFLRPNGDTLFSDLQSQTYVAARANAA